MAPPKLRGVIAAVATPVNEDGSPDTARATKLARFLIDNGCDGLNVLGTTGEATSFSLEERKRVMDAYKAAGLPLDRMMVGTGAAATADAVALTRYAAELGFAGALVLPPFYYKGVPDDGLVAYIDAIVQATAEAGPDLSLPLPAAIRPALARRAGEAAARPLRPPHRRAEGFLRRHELRPRGRGDLEELRRVSVDRSGAARRPRRRVRRLHLGDREPQFRSLPARLEPRATRRRWMPPSPSASCSTASRWSPA